MATSTLAADVLTGATITFGSSFFAQVLSINWSGTSRPAIPTSHLATATQATFIPGRIVDPGGLEVEMHLNADTTVPWSGAAETCTITFPGGATWAGSAFMTNFSWRGGLDEKTVASATLKFTGNITITPDT